MNQKDKKLAYTIYMYLGALFITSLVVCNLIFRKFFGWYPVDVSIFGSKLFEISVGLLPYPITFLITDTVSEIYGKKKANQLVKAGLFASVFSLLIVLVGMNTEATSWSPIDNDNYTHVFGSSAIAVFASMLAYLFAQFIDVHIYHFWKKLTKGKHLWLR
ncbi:MAG: queuosine precursor transporter, partial [Flavobacteriaceae bacterium]|nr:queuosine precursor transporter [Flavobacteriaceae bacterium]